jgi:hypothetical protein
MNKNFHKGGTYRLTMKELDTPFVILVERIHVNPVDSEDVKAANALQDGMKIEAASGEALHASKIRPDELRSRLQAATGVEQRHSGRKKPRRTVRPFAI